MIHSSRREQAKCVRHNHVRKFTKSLLYPPLACLLSSTFLHAAVDDEYVDEQMYSPTGVPESEKSFWDPSFWRDLTAPLESPVVPGQSQWLYFGRKSHTGTPYAESARDLTLYTAARLGFTPPALTPSFSRVYFSGDQIVFNGTPDIPAAPFGRLKVAVPHPLYLTQRSEIEFDRTIVEADNTQVLGSHLTLTGDVSSYNFRSLGTVVIARDGEQTIPSMKLRSGAIAELTTFQYSFTPVAIPATSNTAVAIESDAHFQASSVQLFNTAGKVFDASAGRGRATLGTLFVDGNAPEVDPATLFHATGVASPASAFSVTNNTVLDGFRGVVAQIEDGATMQFHNYLYTLEPNGKMGLRANREGAITMNHFSSTSSSTSGSTQLDWLATTQGRIAMTQLMITPLHLNDQLHTISASSGGKIDLPSSLGIDADGRLFLTATGAGSELLLDGNSAYSPHNYLNDATARWSRINATITDGGMLRGGETIDSGGGSFYADSRSIFIHKTASMSDLTVTGASMKNIGLTFSQASVNCELGAPGSPATLHQASINIGDGSLLIMRGGTWQPERVEMADAPQGLQIGDITGGSIASITDAAVAHSLDLTAGNGVVLNPGDSIPTVANSFLTINDGSTVTGALSAAPYPHGKGTVTITGTATTCGFRNVQLGASSNPSFGNQSGGGPPAFTGEFFSTQGGDSALNVTSGARVAIGAYEGAYGQWRQPSSFSPAYLSAKATPITIGGSSAIYMGDAADATAQDFRNGALVVGTGGYIIGTPTIFGAAADGNDLVVAGGTVAPGFSPGTIEVDGNFLMESGTLVLEVKSNTAGGWDVIDADSITITGGTIIIKPTNDYDSGAGFTADFFQTSNLSISPGVTIQIDPILAGATFSGSTGEISLIGGTEHDLNTNGIDDRFEAVLPAAGNSLEWPSLGSPSISPPTFTFRRIDGSNFTHNITVQWSSDLQNWHDIAIPDATKGAVTIIANDNDPDSIVVSLPTPQGANQKIFARLAIRKISF